MEGKHYEHQHVSSFVLGWVRQCGACCIPCGSNDAAKGSAGSAAKGSGKTIYVLTPSEDHGWTGSVATFAKEKIEEVNKAGVYKAELQTADSASKQIQEVEDILAGNTDEIAGIVIQPMDDTVQSAIQSIVDAGIPYVAFDRIIEAVADTAVSNVKGDNEGIGAGSAAYFVENGMKPGDKVYVYQGDTSSVTTLRDSGFGEYLTGKIEFDGKKIADDAKWTEDQVNDAVTKSGAMNWSRSDTKASFESLMGDEVLRRGRRACHGYPRGPQRRRHLRCYQGQDLCHQAVHHRLRRP